MSTPLVHAYSSESPESLAGSKSGVVGIAGGSVSIVTVTALEFAPIFPAASVPTALGS
jgi:hypothetical protein